MDRAVKRWQEGVVRPSVTFRDEKLPLTERGCVEDQPQQLGIGNFKSILLPSFLDFSQLPYGDPVVVAIHCFLGSD